MILVVLMSSETRRCLCCSGSSASTILRKPVDGQPVGPVTSPRNLWTSFFSSMSLTFWSLSAAFSIISRTPSLPE